jgi:hypothetical protein
MEKICLLNKSSLSISQGRKKGIGGNHEEKSWRGLELNP